MKTLFKILAALLILSLCVFVSCERKEAQGSSSVMTQSETSDTMQEQNKEPGTRIRLRIQMLPNPLSIKLQIHPPHRRRRLMKRAFPLQNKR